jgi:hypothetical protein
MLPDPAGGVKRRPLVVEDELRSRAGAGDEGVEGACDGPKKKGCGGMKGGTQGKRD